MQSDAEQSQVKKILLYSILATGLSLVIANFFGKEIASTVSLTLYVPVTLALVVLSLIMVARFGLKGDHGKAWFLFVIFASLWFIAERIAFYYNFTTGDEPFPSEADAFWLAGYPFLFGFLIFYLRPVKKAISKKMLGLSCLISLALLVPTLYITYADSSEENWSDTVIAVSYPIADAIILIPAIIGVVLFFRGKVNFLWSLMCIAIMFEIAADTGFLLATLDDSYYQGHPVDILYIWYYIIFSFGVYSHVAIFKSHKKDPYKNIEDLR